MPVLPVKGLEMASVDRINKELFQKCNLIEPRYVPVVEHTTFEGSDILVVWATGGEARPYKCPTAISSEKSAKSDRAYYIRKLSITIKTSVLEEKELFMLANNVPYDDRANMQANVEDLQPSLISEYLYAVKSGLHKDALKRPLIDLAKDMKIVGGPAEMVKPINVGLMFFNDRPEEFFKYARIEIVDKPNPTGVGMTEKIFSGPLDRQLRDALSYIQNYIIKEKVIK